MSAPCPEGTRIVQFNRKHKFKTANESKIYWIWGKKDDQTKNMKTADVAFGLIPSEDFLNVDKML